MSGFSQTEKMKYCGPCVFCVVPDGSICACVHFACVQVIYLSCTYYHSANLSSYFILSRDADMFKMLMWEHKSGQRWKAMTCLVGVYVLSARSASPAESVSH